MRGESCQEAAPSPDHLWRQRVGGGGRAFRPQSRCATESASARKEIDAANGKPAWKPCEAPSDDGTYLPGCRKLYIPLYQEGASTAPFGFVFQLVKTAEGLAWNFIAFGERHPSNARTRSVYERAHKRLHGRYP
jgi:hypothetical protein